MLQGFDSVYNRNIDVNNQTHRTRTGWTGGKPKDDDKVRQKRSTPFPKRVIIFSPHPVDDLISMDGILQRLVEQGNNVHIAYQTSANIAVLDEDASRFTDFVASFAKIFEIEQEPILKLHDEVRDS